VEDRVLALLWHLAERWGRMTPEGVVVPLCLTHETLGRLAGAARPTVSLALGELTKRGQLSRRPDGAFVLQPGSAEALRPGRSGVPQMPPLAVAEATGEPGRAFAARRPGIDGALPRPIVDVAALQQRIAALHEDLPVRTQPV
jgi:CRP/FNR family cyclic AMP-dependent transcriptional regulator